MNVEIAPRPLWQRYLAVCVYMLAANALTYGLGLLLIATKILPIPGENDLPFRYLLVGLVAQMIAFLLPAPYLLKFTRSRTFTFKRTSPKDILLTCTMVFSSLIFFSALYQYFGIEPKQLAAIDGADIVRHKGAFLVLTSVAVPAYEEWIFRGLLFGVLVTDYRRAWHVWSAAIFCALVFTFSHYEGVHSLSALPPIFILALIFQFMAWRSQSLWPSVCGHAFQNALSSLAFFAKISNTTSGM